MRRIVHLARSLAVGGIALTLSLGARAAAAEVVVAVAANSPVTSLSKDQAVDIFLGRRSRFPNGQPAQPVDLGPGSAVREAFYRSFANRTPSQIKAHWSKIIFTGRGLPPKEVADAATLKRWLAEHPNAIGYMEASRVDDSVRVLLKD